MEQEVFDRGIAMLFSVFPNRDTSPELLETWRLLLDDIDDETFLEAITAICREEKELYPDTNIVALIRQYARGGSKESLKNKAILAWEAVRRAIADHGYYQSVKFDDPVIHSCIEALGGWRELCSIPLDEMQWKEKKFLELYPVFALNKKEHPRYLVGHVEHQNRLDGYTETIQLVTTDAETQEKTEWDSFDPIPLPAHVETEKPAIPKTSKPKYNLKRLKK